jgi:molybdenum cofactor cytidylyltransferase
MGQLKALLQWQGASLLQHQVKTLLSAGVDRVVVVVGHRAGELTALLEGIDGATWRLNPDYLEGKTTSIKAGLGALDPESTGTVLVLNVDQPRSAETVRFLLDRHQRSGSLITIPEYEGKGGHPILLDASLLGELLRIDEETLGVKAVVRRRQSSTSRVPMDGPEVLWDLNTPEQYEEALRAQIK